jgi:hypothetical protein
MIKYGITCLEAKITLCSFGVLCCRGAWGGDRVSNMLEGILVSVIFVALVVYLTIND